MTSVLCSWVTPCVLCVHMCSVRVQRWAQNGFVTQAYVHMLALMSSYRLLPKVATFRGLRSREQPVIKCSPAPLHIASGCCSSELFQMGGLQGHSPACDLLYSRAVPA